MSVIHFLNVLEGDCNIIQHDSGRVSVIDVSNADNNDDTEAEKAKKNSEARKRMHEMTVPPGKRNFEQKKHPDNPIDYIGNKLKLSSIFRFIVTHPDMDHLDGIADLFSSFEIVNFWDTDNKKEIEDFNGGGYNKEDWELYKKLRDGNKEFRKTYFATNVNKYYDEDSIRVLAPTNELLTEAHKCGDYNDCSYVLLYTPPKSGNRKWKILFAGDSHDKTWQYILANHADEVSDIDVLFAPHHGRDSSRKYDFLKVLRPKVTLFGNASSKHLAYNSYPQTRITNNQAGFVILDISLENLSIYVKNQVFANHFRNRPKRNWGDAPYSADHQAYFLCRYPA